MSKIGVIFHCTMTMPGKDIHPEVELLVYDYYILGISCTMMRVTWFMFAIYSWM